MFLPAALPAQEWKTQYLYDENKSSLTLLDLQFPSIQRGVAVGFVTRGKHNEPACLTTSDGGTTWKLSKPEEMPVSLFFLNEELGWMVGNGYLWKTTEAGRSWTKVGKLPKGPILRVYFLDANFGYAVGGKKTVLETHNGGESWAPVPMAAAPPGDRDYSVYNWVTFANSKLGLIVGFNMPPRRWNPQFPDWMDPQGAYNFRDVPHLSYALETVDSGKTWRSASGSWYGNTSRVRFLPDGTGVRLTEYSQYFRTATEAFLVNWHTGKTDLIYRDDKFGATDIWKRDDGTVILAGVVAPGRLRNLVPGKVQVLTSRDFKTWLAMPVDYRASGYRVLLASPDGRNFWMATDTGMILKLVAPENAAH